jgi:GDP-4-dehydro-6-deoxy-D-mannose reductase
MHVADTVDAYMRLLNCAGSLPHRSLFNVASGRVYRIEALLGMLRARARVPFEIEKDPERLRPSDIPRAEGDATLLRQVTGWRPARGVEEMVGELLDFWRSQIANRTAG